MAASFCRATPSWGEVTCLPTSVLGNGRLFFGDFVPRGVAYLSIGAPAASGRWDVKAAMSQSDVSAWAIDRKKTSPDTPHTSISYARLFFKKKKIIRK